MIAVADTGFVVAVESLDDRDHERCLTVYEQARRIILPQSTLNEVCYLLTQTGGNRATVSFLRRLPERKYEVYSLIADDFARTADLLDQYADSRIDFVDASVAAIAEHLKFTNVFTLDRRDFNIIRPAHATHFDLLPEA